MMGLVCEKECIEVYSVFIIRIGVIVGSAIGFG